MTELARWLAGPEGAAAITAAAALGTEDPLAATATLRARRPHLTPEQAAAALTQATLRRTAAERYGLAEPGLLTRAGLEQATRPDVARIRAGHIAAARPTRVVDATAGLGFDTRALVAALGPAGVPVLAIERDPEVAGFLRANVPAAQVLEGDAMAILPTLDLTPDDVVFVDPARRDHRRSADGARAHPERDPERWSPPWSWVVSLADRTRVCAKVAPGFSAAALPPSWCAQWASWQRTPVEACLFSWPALPRPRRAIAVDAEVILDGDGGPMSPLGPVGAWLHEVDAAVIAAELVDDLIAQTPSVHRIDAAPFWLSGGIASASPLLRSWRILEELPSGARQLRAAVAARGIESITVKTRGGRRDADAVRRALHLPAGAGATIVATDVGGRPAAYLVESA